MIKVEFEGFMIKKPGNLSDISLFFRFLAICSPSFDSGEGPRAKVEPQSVPLGCGIYFTP